MGPTFPDTGFKQTEPCVSVCSCQVWFGGTGRVPPKGPTYSLPLWRVHEIKRMYLASRIHGLFITQTQSFISTTYTRLARYVQD
jgi:hypothetical protein